jgi:hypothetical protein
VLLLSGSVVRLLAKLRLLLVGILEGSEVITDFASVFDAVGHFHFGGLRFWVVVGLEFSIFVLLAVEVIHVHPILILRYRPTGSEILLRCPDSLHG